LKPPKPPPLRFGAFFHGPDPLDRKGRIDRKTVLCLPPPRKRARPSISEIPLFDVPSAGSSPLPCVVVERFSPVFWPAVLSYSRLSPGALISTLANFDRNSLVVPFPKEKARKLRGFCRISVSARPAQGPVSFGAPLSATLRKRSSAPSTGNHLFL